MKDKIISGKPSLIKNINRNLIIQLVIRHGKIGRAELAKMTGLSLPSVMRIAEALIQEGLLLEEGKGLSSGGRKPSLLRLNGGAMYIIGVEIALRTTVVLSNLAGEIIEKWESEEAIHITPIEMLEKIDIAIWHLFGKYKIDWNCFAGIGIGTPGMNFKYLKEIELSILRGWESLDVKEWFEANRRHQKYIIITENVARTRMLNELWFGLGKVYKSFLYVFVDQGVGCGFVNSGSIYLGYHQVSGEFGHSIIVPEGRTCYCGNKGCMEMYISTGAIVREVKETLRIVDEHFVFSNVLDMKEEPKVASILKNSGKMLGYGIGNLINLYNPQVVVLGGAVPSAMNGFSDSAIEVAKECIFSKNAMDTRIVLSAIKRETHCLGSVALVIHTLFKAVELR